MQRTIPTQTPTLRQLKDDLKAHPMYWDDADLAPPPRQERPLSAWT